MILTQRFFFISFLLLFGCSNDIVPKPQSCADLVNYSTNKNGTSAFTWACELGCKKYVEEHINDVDINEENAYGVTPLSAAVVGGPGLVSLLAENGADLHHRDKLTGTSILGVAIEHSRIKIIDYLLSRGVNPNLPSDNKIGYYPIHMAVLFNQPEVLQLLIRYGAKLDVINKRGETPRNLAIRANKKELISLLPK